MTASQSLALFKTPVAQGDYSTDSAFPSRVNPRPRNSRNPQPSPLTQALPDAQNALFLGFIALIVPSVVYSVLQMSSLISGGVLENAIRAFVR